MKDKYVGGKKKWPEMVVEWPNVKFVYFSSSQTLLPVVLKSRVWYSTIISLEYPEIFKEKIKFTEASLIGIMFDI